MPRPSKAGVHIDTLLSNLSMILLQNMDGFVFNKVFKIVPVDIQSNKYPVYDEADWNTDEATVRKDATESAGSGYKISNDNYNCEVFGFHKDIGDQLRQNADNQFDLNREAMEFVTRKIAMKQEIEWVNAFMTSGVWGETLVGGTDFDQISEPTSSPISMFKGEIATMLGTTGIKPNTLVLGYKVFNDLTEHPDFVERVKYTSSNAVSAAIMANLIGIERILVSESVVATGKGATKTTAFTAGRNALLCYSPPNPGLLTPAAGYTFSWNYANIGSIAIDKFYMKNIKAMRVEGEAAFDYKVTSAKLGKLFTLVTEE